MSTARRPAVSRLVVTTVLAVATMLLAPVAGVTTGATAGSSALVASAGSDAAAQAVVAGSARKAGKAAKKAKKAKARTKAKKAKASRVPAQAAVAQASVAWAGSTLRYHDGLPAAWRWSLQAAVDNWNRSGAAITLVPVGDPARAQVRVGYGEIGGSSGLATVGRAQGAFVKLSDRYRSVDPTDPYYRVEVMGVLTHELGHVLGLDHTVTSCELMGPVMDIVGCSIYDMSQPQAYRCDVVDTAAAQNAVRLYGGSAQGRSAATCSLPAA